MSFNKSTNKIPISAIQSYETLTNAYNHEKIIIGWIDAFTSTHQNDIILFILKKMWDHQTQIIQLPSIKQLSPESRHLLLLVNHFSFIS